MEIFDSVDAAWRATLGTVRYEQVGDQVRVVPDFTRAMAADLEYRELPSEGPRDSDFAPFLVRGSKAWEEYFSTRKVVEREMADGTRVASVTSNIAERSRDSRQHRVSGGKVKRYEVVHLLADVSLADKFGISGAFRAAMRNLAVVDTMRAAVKLQEHVRSYEGYEKAEVTVGQYAGSWKAARESVKLQAARFPVVSVATEALFVGDKIFLYGPQGEGDWRVFGPERVAWIVRLVHRMVAATSCESVIFALGPELTVLDIDVHDGVDVLSPSRERHAGDHDELPVGDTSAVSRLMSVDERVRFWDVCKACETIAINGVDSATAVRVTSKYVLINDHVVREEGQITLGGSLVVPHRMLTRDLWLAKVRGPDVAWHLREPAVGELVVLCYRRHADLQFVGPVKVLSAGGEMLTTERVPGMLPGVSGAAVVALRDFALLGVYDGTAMRRALVGVFSPTMYTDVCSLSDTGDGSHASARGGEGSIYDKMKRRGLAKVVDAAMQAVVPLYSGTDHVGMGFPSDGGLLTTCDPDVSPLSLGHGQEPLVFARFGVGTFRAGVRGLPPGPAIVRFPSYGEEVFVVGKDAEGDYFSVTTAKVTHVGVGAENFRLAGLALRDALPLQGGLVVSLVDAAVVGVFARSQYDVRHGEVSYCYSVPKPQVDVAEEKPEVSLLKLFPFLRPETWPDGMVTGAVTHASAAPGAERRQTGLAMVGDSAMRTLLWVGLLEGGKSPAEWQQWYEKCQTNARQAAVCEELGLHTLLRVGQGLVVGRGSKLYADLLEAVAGAVYLSESQEKFEMFCRAVRAVRESYEDVT